MKNPRPKNSVFGTSNIQFPLIEMGLLQALTNEFRRTWIQKKFTYVTPILRANHLKHLNLVTKACKSNIALAILNTFARAIYAWDKFSTPDWFWGFPKRRRTKLVTSQFYSIFSHFLMKPHSMQTRIKHICFVSWIFTERMSVTPFVQSESKLARTRNFYNQIGRPVVGCSPHR